MSAATLSDIRDPDFQARIFREACVRRGLPAPVAELRFAPPRRWRFDWSWPDYRVALEIEGGAWVNGRHNRASGFIKDIEKYSEAAILGWCVLRLIPTALLSTGVGLVDRALTIRGFRVPAAVGHGITRPRGASDAKRL